MRRVVLAAVALVALAGSDRAAGESPGLPLEPCSGSQHALCGTLDVPEDPALPDGRRIGLRVTVLPALDRELRRPGALFVLAGGPGGAATELVSFATSTFIEYWGTRDIVLVDQRGTGAAALSCVFPAPLSALAPPETVRAGWESCLVGLDADPTRYTTAVAMEDLDLVRAALGYERIDLYGGSYGATAAQVYLHLHGDRVRSVVLDGGTLLDIPIFEHWAANAQRVLDRLLARCARTARCRKAYPRPAAELRSLLARLDRKPLVVGGAVVTDETLANGIQTLTRRPETAVWVPWLVRQLRLGRVERATREAERLIGQGLGIDVPSLVMHWSIRCSEGWARFDAAASDARAKGSYLASAMRQSALLQAGVCAAMPKGVVPEGTQERVRSTVPTLVLVGAEDPQDPLANVAGVTAAMPNARVVVVPAAGHGAVGVGCTADLADRFLIRGTARGLDTRCVSKEPLPPFVLP